MKFNKKDGTVGKMGIILLALISMFIALMMMISAFGDMENKSKVDSIGRKYILSMESKGYLSNEDEIKMINELKSIGGKNISTVGTTKSKVGYGNDIFLKVNGQIEVSAYEFKAPFDIKKTTELVNMEIDLSSIAKN